MKTLPLFLLPVLLLASSAQADEAEADARRHQLLEAQARVAYAEDELQAMRAEAELTKVKLANLMAQRDALETRAVRVEALQAEVERLKAQKAQPPKLTREQFRAAVDKLKRRMAADAEAEAAAEDPLVHLATAARHLRAAGAVEAAERIEREIRERKAAQAATPDRTLLATLRALRQEVGALRKEVAEIKALLQQDR